MVNWEDREYINPRQRKMKDVESGKIHTFEIQDDLDNISKESKTPLTAHNLNLAQQELLSDMSQDHLGITSITADTKEGCGTCHAVYRNSRGRSN